MIRSSTGINLPEKWGILNESQNSCCASIRRSGGRVNGIVAEVSLSPASPAFAYTRHDGNCEGGEVCLWKGSGYTGCEDNYGGNVSNYAGRYYVDCASTILNDSVRSLNNYGTFYDVTVYENSGYKGAEITTAAGSSRGASLGVLREEISSHYW
ncbi:peptidase inhibitor family I36 protein [Actinoplanes couchii]|uniref:Uncharacterized protein n=1 Tax=Actinoplanes couchii TaxID=403638 RepID=A0ABQ3XI11_9ACTN|nr:peptidase inhibitor family I36 protein [Actinoplanes couchii]MDR6324579.1 hypothetical protein [Actinoplanes couchii]GID58131.1 hypothetical protein Aco03nite_065350 [Actinoplanes couchii]